MRLLTIAFLAAVPSALIAYAVVTLYPWSKVPSHGPIDQGLHQMGLCAITFLVSWLGFVVTSVLGLAILRR